jgi:hypothetical protein
MNRLVAVAAFVLLGMGLFVAPATAGEAQTYKLTTSIAGTNSCTGESIQGTAVAHVVFKDEIVNGTEHFIGFFQVAIKAVSNTGVAYTGTFGSRTQFNGPVDNDGTFEVTEEVQNVAVSKGSAENELAHTTVHLTINSIDGVNGEVTAEAVNFFIECRG